MRVGRTDQGVRDLVEDRVADVVLGVDRGQRRAQSRVCSANLQIPARRLALS